jgi:hypothetical protein
MNALGDAFELPLSVSSSTHDSAGIDSIVLAAYACAKARRAIESREIPTG